MKKEIKAYGNTHVLVLTKEDLEVYKLKRGDILDIIINDIERRKK